MKKVLVLLSAIVCLSAQAQPLVGKKVKKTRKAKIVKPVEPQNYTSKNGTMVVHSIDKNEQLDTATNATKMAPHINSNYNETMPGLAPSNGSKK